MGEHTYLKSADESSLAIDRDVSETVREILGDVRDRGNEAIREFTRQFDDVERENLQVGAEEIETAAEELSNAEREAIDNTIANVREFHETQFEHIGGFETEFQPGITMGQRVLPVERVGIYIPGGRHPLVATPAMTIVPATVAGVDEVIACAPQIGRAHV